MSILFGVKKNSARLSSVERRAPHVALTHFLRKKHRDIRALNAILTKCNVSPYLGALPPELRACTPRENLDDVTYRFRMCMEDFLIANIYDIRESIVGPAYEISEIGRLFNTQCLLKFGAINAYGFRVWSGRFGIVGKMSFPQLNAQYALKLFDRRIEEEYGSYGIMGRHGMMHEISTAFAAVHAEPCDNARVYMASLIYEPYLLSRWEGDAADGDFRENKNEIFATKPCEVEARNYRSGRRIDFGETYRTLYGATNYRVRKMFRKIINAIDMRDMASIQYVLNGKSAGFSASEISAAMDLVRIEATDVQYMVLEYVAAHMSR